MLRIARLVVVLLTASTITQADIQTDVNVYQPNVEPGSDPAVPDFNDGSCWVVDLMVDVYGNDDWTSSQIAADLWGGSFFYHPLGDRTPPTAELVAEHPALEYDTMLLTTGSDGGNMPPYEDPSGVVRDVFGEWDISVDTWFGMPPNGGDGNFVIARLTVRLECDRVDLHLQGAHTTNKHGGELFPFDIHEPLTPIPEGDIDRDGCVGQQDLGLLLAAWGSDEGSGNWDCRADLDWDGYVGQADLGLLLANWGDGCE